ncbi:RsmD family RNA methyltransferase [Flindersiella endophytica]
MSRIVAGEAGGRRLVMPSGSGTRPTSDRVREALFASLLSEVGELDGLAFLDLYAGSGAVGCEALSRGAERALFVESDKAAAAVVRRNLRDLGLGSGGRGELAVKPVEKLAATVASAPHDIVFADPPYALGTERLASVLSALRANGWLVPDAIVVVERATRSDAFAWPEGFSADRSRRYGDTTLWYGHAEISHEP